MVGDKSLTVTLPPNSPAEMVRGIQIVEPKQRVIRSAIEVLPLPG